MGGLLLFFLFLPHYTVFQQKQDHCGWLSRSYIPIFLLKMDASLWAGHSWSKYFWLNMFQNHYFGKLDDLEQTWICGCRYCTICFDSSFDLPNMTANRLILSIDFVLCSSVDILSVLTCQLGAKRGKKTR
jgi:hypothetical protein